MKTPLSEALKEFARTFLLGAVPMIVLLVGVITAGINTATGVIAINWGVVLATSIVSVLGLFSTALMSAADKFKHEEGKEANPESKKSFGITGF